jgi:low affinity Fe/Cu permease
MRAAKVTVKVSEDPVQDASPAETTIGTRSDRFARFSARSSHYLGSRWAFIGAIGVILVWAVTGPIFHYSDTWQLVINTGTTIVTFLMVFLIQNTQNRDARAIHLKLNELIHAIDKARNNMIDVENLSDLELDELARTYEKIRSSAEERQQKKRKLAPR